MADIYKDDFVTVTEALVRTGNDTYQIKQINSTKIGGFPVVQNNAKAFLYAAGIATVVGAIAGLIHGGLGFLATIITWGIVFSKLYQKPKTKYVIHLSTSNGQVDGFSSFDKTYVEKINNAILEAMTKAA